MEWSPIVLVRMTVPALVCLDVEHIYEAWPFRCRTEDLICCSTREFCTRVIAI